MEINYEAAFPWKLYHSKFDRGTIEYIRNKGTSLDNIREALDHHIFAQRTKTRYELYRPLIANWMRPSVVPRYEI
jgi:hypothetical protein